MFSTLGWIWGYSGTPFLNVLYCSKVSTQTTEITDHTRGLFLRSRCSQRLEQITGQPVAADSQTRPRAEPPQPSPARSSPAQNSQRGHFRFSSLSLHRTFLLSSCTQAPGNNYGVFSARYCKQKVTEKGEGGLGEGVEGSRVCPVYHCETQTTALACGRQQLLRGEGQKVPTATSPAAETQLPPFLFHVLFYKPVLTQRFIPSPIYGTSPRLFL